MKKSTKDTAVAVVYETKDYEKFGKLPGNREVSRVNITRMMRSLESKDLNTPIIVNDKFQIVDGQRRFEARKNLEKPIRYIIADEYDLPEVHILNSDTIKWSPRDYAQGYVARGVSNYVRYEQFQKKYTFGHPVMLALFYDTTSTSAAARAEFMAGKLEIKNFSKATKIADMIRDYASIVPGWWKRPFVFAMLRLFRNPHYDHTVHLQRALAWHKSTNKTIPDYQAAIDYYDEVEAMINHGAPTGRRIAIDRSYSQRRRSKAVTADTAAGYRRG